MGTNCKVDSIAVVGNIMAATRKNTMALLALGNLLSEHHLAYLKGVAEDTEDMRHNLEELFDELRTIEEVLSEENIDLIEFQKRVMRGCGENVQ